jgi:hypothetical protein
VSPDCLERARLDDRRLDVPAFLADPPIGLSQRAPAGLDPRYVGWSKWIVPSRSVSGVTLPLAMFASSLKAWWWREETGVAPAIRVIAFSGTKRARPVRGVYRPAAFNGTLREPARDPVAGVAARPAVAAAWDTVAAPVACSCGGSPPRRRSLHYSSLGS